MKKLLLAGCLILLGCGTQQNVYLKDIGQSEKITLEKEAALPKITVGSNLSITVTGLEDAFEGVGAFPVILADMH